MTTEYTQFEQIGLAFAGIGFVAFFFLGIVYLSNLLGKAKDYLKKLIFIFIPVFCQCQQSDTIQIQGIDNPDHYFIPGINDAVYEILPDKYLDTALIITGDHTVDGSLSIKVNDISNDSLFLYDYFLFIDGYKGILKPKNENQIRDNCGNWYLRQTNYGQWKSESIKKRNKFRIEYSGSYEVTPESDPCWPPHGLHYTEYRLDLDNLTEWSRLVMVTYVKI